MNTEHIELNRPIHIARRDVFYERAVELLHLPMVTRDIGKKIHHLEAVLNFLKSAERHGQFALRSSQVLQTEKDFIHFIQLLVGTVQSILSMMKHILHLESEEGFLAKFLQIEGSGNILPTHQYERRAEDILQGLWQMLRLSHIPFQHLRKKQIEGLSEVDLERFHRAETSFRQEARKIYVPPQDLVMQGPE